MKTNSCRWKIGILLYPYFHTGQIVFDHFTLPMWAWSLAPVSQGTPSYPAPVPARGHAHTAITIEGEALDPRIYVFYRDRQSCILGVIQILIALGSVLFCGLATYFRATFANHYYIPFTVSGMGIFVSNSKPIPLVNKISIIL